MITFLKIFLFYFFKYLLLNDKVNNHKGEL